MMSTFSPSFFACFFRLWQLGKECDHGNFYYRPRLLLRRTRHGITRCVCGLTSVAMAPERPHLTFDGNPVLEFSARLFAGSCIDTVCCNAVVNYCPRESSPLIVTCKTTWFALRLYRHSLALCESHILWIPCRSLRPLSLTWKNCFLRLQFGRGVFLASLNSAFSRSLPTFLSGDATDLHDMSAAPLGRSVKRSIRFGQYPLQSNPASHKSTRILISAPHAS